MSPLFLYIPEFSLLQDSMGAVYIHILVLYPTGSFIVNLRNVENLWTYLLFLSILPLFSGFSGICRTSRTSFFFYRIYFSPSRAGLPICLFFFHIADYWFFARKRLYLTIVSQNCRLCEILRIYLTWQQRNSSVLYRFLLCCSLKWEKYWQKEREAPMRNLFNMDNPLFQALG